MGSFSEKLKRELPNEQPTSANTNSTLGNRILPRPSLSSQACRLIKILKPQNKASCLNPSNPILHLAREAHQPWQLMGCNSLRESLDNGAAPFSDPYWGNQLWFMLMNGINFVINGMTLVMKHHRTQEKLHYRFILKTKTLGQEKRILHMVVCHVPWNIWFHNPKVRWSLFLLSSFNKDIWHSFVQKKKKVKKSEQKSSYKIFLKINIFYNNDKFHTTMYIYIHP